MTDKTPRSVPEAEDAPREAEAPREHDVPREEGAQHQDDARQEAGAAGADGAAAQGHTGAGRPVIEVSPAVHKRLTTGLGGFTMAMAACLVLVLAIYAVTPRSDEQILPTVDYSAQLWAMSNDAPFTVYAPEGLSERWRPTSSRLHGLGKGGDEPVAWHLGFVTPGDEYAALEQSNEKASEYIPRMTNSSVPIGTHQVGGDVWNKYHRKDKKANSLARTLPDGTSLVVTGTATYEELAVLAASLKPQSKDGAPLTPTGAATPGS
ncbi:DUF4245 domain-containing protein [Actinomadura sp. 6K520]|uniref:DUF4245 domain-containing protein n=1 Tax=Actinomadura sp. 6K520 TaxID=2530364 RepID=UPI001FB828FA|nr:DUF4245 domain-containing protein [Actinomadura sp. 6K520]